MNNDKQKPSRWKTSYYLGCYVIRQTTGIQKPIHSQSTEKQNRNPNKIGSIISYDPQSGEAIAEVEEDDERISSNSISSIQIIN